MSHAAVSHEHGAEGSHGTLKSYIIGFILSIVLTLVSFALGGAFDGHYEHSTAVIGLIVFCVVQLLVQLGFFLHLGSKQSSGGRTSIFAFTVLLLAIVIGGTVWVMYSMAAHMTH